MALVAWALLVPFSRVLMGTSFSIAIDFNFNLRSSFARSSHGVSLSLFFLSFCFFRSDFLSSLLDQPRASLSARCPVWGAAGPGAICHCGLLAVAALVRLCPRARLVLLCHSILIRGWSNIISHMRGCDHWMWPQCLWTGVGPPRPGHTAPPTRYHSTNTKIYFLSKNQSGIIYTEWG